MKKEKEDGFEEALRKEKERCEKELKKIKKGERNDGRRNKSDT